MKVDHNEETERRASARDRVLARLRRGPATGNELNRICFRYGARIHELRVIYGQEFIARKQLAHGVFRYTLHEPAELKQVVRCGLFETNSSSCHSIVIAKGDFIADILPVHRGVITIHPDEFGWSFHGEAPVVVSDAATKASYCLTYVACGLDRAEDLSIREPNHVLLDMLRAVIRAETGARAVRFKKSNDRYSPWGYIDHQSCDVCAAAFTSADALRNFIFNPTSTLTIDHDNH